MPRTRRPTKAEKREFLMNSIIDIAKREPTTSHVGSNRVAWETIDLLLEYLDDPGITGTVLLLNRHLISLVPEPPTDRG